MPRPLRLVLFVMCLVAIVLGILTAATNLIPPRAHAWIALALSIVIALRDAIPVLWARLVTSPDAEPVRVTDAVIKVGVVLLLLAGVARANPIAPGVALPPGPQEIAAEAVRPQQSAPQPITYAADLGPLQVSPMLFAQRAAAPEQPGVSNLQQNANTPPPAPLTRAEQVQLAAKSAVAGVEAARSVPVSPGFWQTKGGQAMSYILDGCLIVATTAGAVAGVWVAAR